MLGVVLAGFFPWLNRAQAQPIRSVAVLPFRVLGSGAKNDYFAAGINNAVTTDLAESSKLKVVSETSVARFKNTTEPIPQIARALGVDGVVEGAVLQEGGRVRITVHLIRAGTDRHIWTDSYERQLTNILALQDPVAQGVADAVDAKLSPGVTRKGAPSRQVNTSAYQAYLEGHYYAQNPNEDFFRAKGYFEQAIQLDPSFALAYAGLSDYYCKISDGGLPSRACQFLLLELESGVSLRIGETLALRRSDVDFARHEIHIRQSVDAVTREVQAVKSKASSADLPMSSQLEQRLRTHLGNKPGSSELLFVNRNGRPFNANKLRERLHLLLTNLGIERGGFHSLRHGAASSFLSGGATPAVVQRQMRHSDARITVGIYGHVIGDEQRAVVQNRSARLVN